MSDIDGITLAERILNLRSHCMILLISGNSDEEDLRKRACSLGFALEGKPMHVDDLVSAIHRLLTERELMRGHIPKKLEMA